VHEPVPEAPKDPGVDLPRGDEEPEAPAGVVGADAKPPTPRGEAVEEPEIEAVTTEESNMPRGILLEDPEPVPPLISMDEPATGPPGLSDGPDLRAASVAVPVV